VIRGRKWEDLFDSWITRLQLIKVRNGDDIASQVAEHFQSSFLTLQGFGQLALYHTMVGSAHDLE
jgi:hypothetical protein